MEIFELQHAWPKRMPISKYIARWYTSRAPQSVINDIKSGVLPGGNDGPGRSWYVWVNADFTPAHGYNPELAAAGPEKPSGALSEKARLIVKRALAG